MATPQTRIIPRYAHTAGPTSMAYSPDGKYLITVGNNELIRKYTVASEDEPVTLDHNHTGDSGVAASNDVFVVSSEDGTVSLFSMATNTLTQLLVRTSLPTRGVAISPDGLWVAVASDETVVKVVSVEDNHKVLTLRSQSSSAKHLSFHPSGNYLAVSGTDGTVYIYSLTTEEPEMIKKVDGVIRSLDAEAEASSKVAWHPDGRAFVAATAVRELVVVDRTSWSRQKVFKDGHNGDITDYAWSPNGAFLASAGTDGKLVIWETKTQTVVARYEYKNIVSLGWHPKENTVSFTTNQGQLYTLPNAVPTDLAFVLKLSIRPAPLLHDTAAPTVVENRGSKPAAAPSRRDRSPSLDDLLGDNYDSDDGADLADFVDNDDDGGYVEPRAPKRPGTHLDPGTHPSKRPAYTPWSPTIHEPFQPGSTPWKGNRRYLTLTLLGFIWTVTQDTHHTVTVEFYDRDTYRDYHFTDPFLYDKACLTANGALFACPPKDGNPAMVYYRPHETWTARADWRIPMPEGEEVSSVALSESYVVVCTSKGYVRVYTLFGIPLRVYRQKHAPVVSCASWGDYVLVMGNGPVGADGRTMLTYCIENVKRDETLQSDDVVALPEDGEVASVFWSSEGVPCVYDSEGVLLACMNWGTMGGAKWVPLLDTRGVERKRGGRKEETYWPVAVAGDKFHCIILKGGDKHPYFPRPLLHEFDFCIPLTTPPTSDAAPSKSDQLEETFVRESILLGLQEAGTSSYTASETIEIAKRNNMIDKTLLQLLGMECQDEDHGAKALEICGLFRQKRTLDMAVKVAVRFGRTVLAGKIGELRDSMEMEED